MPLEVLYMANNKQKIKEKHYLIKTICYGTTREWQTREEAERFFIECMCHSEGSEKERYLKILYKLKSGFIVCDDN